ncbi:unnamed protein product, partial [Brassica rapa]
QPTWAKITQTVHGKGQRAEPRGPKSPKQSTGRASVLSPKTNVLICVLMDSHGRPVSTDVLCVLTDTHGRPVCADEHTPTAYVLCVLNTQPTWAKITQTVHGKGQRAESKDQRADMCTDGQPRTFCTDTHGHTQTATNVLCVLTDTHRQPWTSRGCPSTYILCVLTDSHGRPVCADGHTRTSLCVLTNTHGRPVCTEQTANVGQNRPRGPKSPKQSTGRASVLSPKTNVLICVPMDSHGRPVCADGHTWTHRLPRTLCVCRRTHRDVLCVLMDTHGRPVCADGHTRTDMDSHGRPTQTVHRKGQRAESKDQRADMCTDGQPGTSCVC